MAERFYAITGDEMHTFLTELGFSKMSIPGTVELVYGKIVKPNGQRLSLRVYTGINPNGRSRGKGEDAIRVQLYHWHEGRAVPVGKAQKCLRVKNWQNNLSAAIERHSDPEHFRVCPACNSPMVERENSKTGQTFWGCVTYPRCTGKPKPQQPATEKPAPRKPQAIGIHHRIPDNLISPQQREVRRLFTEAGQHIIMGARAGSGKTAMLRDLSSFRQQGQKFVYLAFNKKNAAEGRRKLPREVTSVTTHSFCSRWLRAEMKLPEKSDEGKTWQLLEGIFPALNNKERKRIRKAVIKLVGLAKNFACKPEDTPSIRAVMDDYTFEVESSEEAASVIEITQEVLERSLPKNCGLQFEFNDLLWWPVVLGMQPPKHDVVLADECQDFNACQIEMLRRLEVGGARIVAVGDPFQAVYRFRGADSDAYDKLKVMLEGTQRGCKEVTLPTNYRCGKAIIDFVRENTIVKDIEAAPNAVDGAVRQDMTYLQVLDLLVAEYGTAA